MQRGSGECACAGRVGDEEETDGGSGTGGSTVHWRRSSAHFYFRRLLLCRNIQSPAYAVSLGHGNTAAATPPKPRLTLTFGSFVCLWPHLYCLVRRRNLRRPGNPWLSSQTARTSSAYSPLSTERIAFSRWREEQGAHSGSKKEPLKIITPEAIEKGQDVPICQSKKMMSE